MADTKIYGGAPLPEDNCTIGYFDYNDLATASSALVVTVAGSPVALTNDAAGPQTIRDFRPTTANITDVWDEVGGVFDWSQLELGCMVDIRLAIDVITASPNTEVNVELHLGTGGNAYTIPFITDTDLKAADTHPLNRYNALHIADANTRDNGGVFKITTDKDCTVHIIGWYCKVLVRG